MREATKRDPYTVPFLGNLPMASLDRSSLQARLEEIGKPGARGFEAD